jgi:hypothetical protein
VGTLELYNKFIDDYEGKNLYLHNTKHEYKYKKERTFIKKIESPDKINRLFERALPLQPYIPTLLKRGEFFYSYEYVQGDTLYQRNEKDIYLKFLGWFGDVFCQNTLCGIEPSQYAHDFYVEKTQKRLSLFQETHENFALLDSIQHVNGVLVMPMQSYLDQIDWDNLCKIVATPLFHGDLQFDNIVYTAEGGFKLIDWREDFGGNTCNGDLYYDLAKLYGGMELNYLEMKKPTSYSTMITQSQSRCFISHYTDERLKSIQQNEFMDFLEKYQLNATKVKLLTAIILLNMAPLHINEFDVFLFFKSKLLFEEIRRKEKNNVWDFLHKND